MTTPTVTTSPRTTIVDLITQMMTTRTPSVPVVADNRLVGIVTGGDIIAAHRCDNQAITAEVHRRLTERGLLDGADVTTTQGVVTIHAGHASIDERIGKMMTNIAETVPGVTQVRLQP